MPESVASTRETAQSANNNNGNLVSNSGGLHYTTSTTETTTTTTTKTWTRNWGPGGGQTTTISSLSAAPNISNVTSWLSGYCSYHETSESLYSGGAVEMIAKSQDLWVETGTGSANTSETYFSSQQGGFTAGSTLHITNGSYNAGSGTCRIGLKARGDTKTQTIVSTSNLTSIL